MPAQTATCLCGGKRKTVAFLLHRLREIITVDLESKNEGMSGSEIEVGES